MIKRDCNKKGFTIIELIVVIAILGILVLLAGPKLLGYVEKAEKTRIQHDVKVMENKMGEVLNQHNHNYDDWENNDKDLGSIILRKKLFEKEGEAKNVDLNHLTLSNKKIVELNDNLGVGGNLHLLNEEENIDNGYKIIPNKYKDEIGTRLDGTFYSNSLGKVYYEHHKPLTKASEKEVLACVAPEILGYEFSIIGGLGTITGWSGNATHLVIPSAFKMSDGDKEWCEPVRVIGAGSSQNGNFKKLTIPQSVEEIQDEAFQGGELIEIKIPHSVKTVGDNAFAYNPATSSGGSGGSSGGFIIVKGSSDDRNISDSAFGGSDYTYSPISANDLDVITKTKTDSNGNKSVSIAGNTGRSYGGSSSYSSLSNNSRDYSNTVINIPKELEIGGEVLPVTEIEKGAFQGSELIDVIMPEGLLYIDDYAFAGNQLIRAIIPNSVISVGNYAFAFNEINKEPTMRSVSIKQEEQVEKINKVGDIEEYGSKVYMLKNSVELLSQIFVTSSSNFRIPEDYYPGIQVKTELVGLEPVVNGGDPSKGQRITSNVDVTWNGNLSNKGITIVASSNAYTYSVPSGIGSTSTRTGYSPLNLQFLDRDGKVVKMIDGITSVSIGAGDSSRVTTSTVTVPEGAVTMRFSSSKSATLREISIPEGVILPQSVSNVISETDDTNIALSWDYNSHHEKVAVYRENKFLTFVTGQSFVDKLINPGTKYTYQLKALDKDGNTSPGYIEHTASTTIPELQFHGVNSNVIDGNHATGQSLTNLYVTWNKDLSNKGITIVASSNAYTYSVPSGIGGTSTRTGYSPLNLQFLNENNEVITMTDGKTAITLSNSSNSSQVTTTVTVPKEAATMRFYSSKSGNLHELTILNN